MQSGSNHAPQDTPGKQGNLQAISAFWLYIRARNRNEYAPLCRIDITIEQGITGENQGISFVKTAPPRVLCGS